MIRTIVRFITGAVPREKHKPCCRCEKGFIRIRTRLGIFCGCCRLTCGLDLPQVFFAGGSSPRLCCRRDKPCRRRKSRRWAKPSKQQRKTFRQTEWVGSGAPEDTIKSCLQEKHSEEQTFSLSGKCFAALARHRPWRRSSWVIPCWSNSRQTLKLFLIMTLPAYVADEDEREWCVNCLLKLKQHGRL